MTVLYNIAFFLFCLVYLPTFFLKKKSRDHLGERFGALPKQTKGKEKIFWLHAVSVGETLATKPLVKKIREHFPEVRFAFPTTTKTGRAIFESLRKPDELLFYFPLDFSGVVQRSLQRLKPDLFAMMETEIWPNLILALKRRQVPILLLNGRISDKSFQKYRWIQWAIRRPLKEVDLFCMQYTEDGERIRSLGARPEKVHIVGNMKFDLDLSPQEAEEASGARGRLGLEENEILWVAGSTHPGEEEVLLEVYTDLAKAYPRLRLLIAPRHPERAKEVVKLIGSFDRKARLFSENGRWERNSSFIFVLDTIGQLRSFYAASDMVFVGGSLVPRRGGQNLLEPAFFEKPILFGPHMDNFRDIVEFFLQGEAALQVADKETLLLRVRSLLESDVRRRQLGAKAKKILLEHQGVVDRHLELIQPFLR